MSLGKVKYSELNSRQKETYNFHIIAAILAEYGFNCIKLSDDYEGADFLAYNMKTAETLKVQLKGRYTIDKKYEDQVLGKKKDIYMAFPIKGEWHLIKHKTLVEKTKDCARERYDYYNVKGACSAALPSLKLQKALCDYKLGRETCLISNE